MHGVSQFITDVKAHAGNGNPVFCPCKYCKESQKLSSNRVYTIVLDYQGFMPNYTIWTMHDEVGVNVLQGNDDDVDMPDIAIHDADEEPDVNTEPMATVNNMFRNTLADDTEDNDGISQLLHNVETGCLSKRQLRKLEKIRQDGKTPLYKNCPMSKLEADIMLLEFKSTNGLSDNGFNQLLGIIRKMLPEKNELPYMATEACQCAWPDRTWL